MAGRFQELLLLIALHLYPLQLLLATPSPNYEQTNASDRNVVDEYLSVDRVTTCQPMDPQPARYCSHYHYDHTLLPNLLNHVKQGEALNQFLGFRMLLQSGCSHELNFLLCSYYFPPCSPPLPPSLSSSSSSLSISLVTPCRALCERVRDQCLPVMRNNTLGIHFDWPVGMECDRLPEQVMSFGPSNENVICLDGPAVVSGGLRSQPRPELPTDCPTATPLCSSGLLRKQTFRSNAYDFIVKARFIGAMLKGGYKALQVNVQRILSRSAKLRTRMSRRGKQQLRIILLTDAHHLCDCPRLAPGQSYLFAGHETNNKEFIVRNSSGLISPFQKGGPSLRKIRRWLKKLNQATTYTPTSRPL